MTMTVGIEFQCIGGLGQALRSEDTLEGLVKGKNCVSSLYSQEMKREITQYIELAVEVATHHEVTWFSNLRVSPSLGFPF